MTFDFKNPDYVAVIRERVKRLAWIKAHPEEVPDLKKFYRDNPAQFISDWGCTSDPRNVERELPVVIPFILFPKQEEWVAWLVDHWRNQKPGLTEKTRDMGMSWLSIAASCTMCLHYEGMAIGFGSRKEEYVDKIGAPKSLFHKGRVFMSNLPKVFRGGWDLDKDAPHLRINFPETNSNISGEAGDNIGRGDRTGIYFVDEAAYLERPQLIEASLSQTTNCRMDISSPNGMGNPFAEKRFGGKIDVFTFHWRDDPRKDDVWYDKQVRELDEVTLAQEVNIDYAASVEGVVIPNQWVRSAVDAHLRLSIKPTGACSGSLDVADEGKDNNAFCGAHGVLVQVVEEWSGKNSDIFATTEKAFELCDLLGYKKFKYDADGLGAGVRGDSRIINEKRKKANQQQITVEAHRGSEGVFNPEGEDVKGRKNEDYFQNHKAQAWWSLRTRFQKTHRWITTGEKCDPDDIISLSSGLKNLNKLISELSQATYGVSQIGKLVIDKSPDGIKSPNLADSVVIQYGQGQRAPMVISEETMRRFGR